MFLNFLLVALGGSIGAVFRYGISLLDKRYLGHEFPWGTLTANTVGCLLMGFLVGLGIQKNVEPMFVFLGVGVLGAMTTFSTFSADTLQMAMDGRWGASAGNVIANLVASLAACFGGLMIAKMASGS